MKQNTLLYFALLCLSYWAVDGKVQRIPSRRCLKMFGNNETIYDHSIPSLSGDKNISLSDYRGKQEPAKNHSELMNGIKYVRPGNGFEPKFPLTQKIDVNGDKEHPIYTYLKKHCPSTRDGFANKYDLFYAPMKNWDVRWNFEKFLVDTNGYPYIRYDPSTEPIEGITADIEALTRSEL